MEGSADKRPGIFRLAKGLAGSQLIIPFAALALLLLFNLITDPSFFTIALGQNQAGEPVFSGYIINILNNGSELAILAIGMTLVTAASGGQDISVGATIATAGSALLAVFMSEGLATAPFGLRIAAAFGVACIVGMLCGSFNGLMVAGFKVQPMVATLILYTAGRSIAAWINNNLAINVSNKAFSYFGGYIPGIPIPTPVLIAALCVVVIMLVLKFTTLGLYVQTVGINEKAARLNGLNPALIKFATFVILGLCVAVAALIKVSRSAGITYSTIAKNIEMDAILAVALGGNALSGGKFNMGSSVLGAYIIQLLTTTLYKFNVSSDALPAYKAVVVIILVVLSSPIVRDKISTVWKRYQAHRAAAAEGTVE